MRPPIFFGVPGATLVTVLAFWITFYVWFFGEIWLGWRKRVRPADSTTRDRGSKWVLISSVWVTVGLGIGVGMGLPDAAITTGRSTLFIVGLLLMVVGVALRWYSIYVLGVSFTCEVATRAGQHVMQSGPYRWVRHPSYTGGLLTVRGILICCLNWVSLVAIVLALFGYSYRIHVEEQALADALGDEYRTYTRRTRRLIPFIL